MKRIRTVMFTLTRLMQITPVPMAKRRQLKTVKTIAVTIVTVIFLSFREVTRDFR
jgi:hypothetical protein